MRRKGAYVPERGDAVWITVDPQAGHEQAARRPALVMSPSAYNGRVGLALLCPITTQVKGYPFEVPLPAGLPVAGVVGAYFVMSMQAILPYALCFAAGAMIFVVVEELIPESQNTLEHVDLVTMATMAGFAVMMVLDVALS